MLNDDGASKLGNRARLITYNKGIFPDRCDALDHGLVVSDGRNVGNHRRLKSLHLEGLVRL